MVAESRGRTIGEQNRGSGNGAGNRRAISQGKGMGTVNEG